MTDLIRAAQAVAECSALDASCSQCMTKLKAALVAHRAEILRRREESPWKGPFKIVRGHEGYQAHDSFNTMICDGMGGREADFVFAALNAYFGYDENGEDVLNA